MKKWFVVALLGWLSLACDEKKSEPSQDWPDSKEYAYLHLVGKLGTSSIQMNLVQDLDYEDNPWYNGYFTFDDGQEPIGFYSTQDSTGQGLLILTESSLPDVPYGTFKGKWGQGTYTGEYINAAGKSLPFSLKVAYPAGTLSFEAKRFQKIELADKNRKDSPKAQFGYEVLIPKEKWLQKAFLQEMLGDSLARVYQTVERAFTQEQVQYMQDYHSQIDEMLADGEDGMYLNYDQQLNTEILFNQDHLLSVAFLEYSYAGGAHGNYGSHCVSFDLKQQKKLTLQDIFKPGYQKGLTKALTKVAKDRFQVENLEETLFVKEIEPNDNFFLTGKGICFNYVPYEIAAYAAGELKFFVPFSDIKSLLK